MSATTRTGQWFVSAFTENLGLKALALAFALGLYFYQSKQEGELIQRTFPVGVVVQLPAQAKDIELMSAVPGTVQITVKGTVRQINELVRQGLPPVKIDLRRDPPPSQLTFEAQMFDLPAGLEYVRVEPRGPFQLDWQHVRSRALPVVASISGTPAPGFVVVGKPTVKPATVYIEGPESVIDSLQSAHVTSLDVSDKKAGEWGGNLLLDEPPARTRYRGTGKVLVSVEIVLQLTERHFERPVEVIGVASGKSVPTEVTVTVSGPPDIVERLKPEQVVPLADVSKAREEAGEERHGSALVPLRVVLDGIETEIQPPSVTVRW